MGSWAQVGARGRRWSRPLHPCRSVRASPMSAACERLARKATDEAAGRRHMPQVLSPPTRTGGPVGEPLCPPAFALVNEPAAASFVADRRPRRGRGGGPPRGRSEVVGLLTNHRREVSSARFGDGSRHTINETRFHRRGFLRRLALIAARRCADTLRIHALAMSLC
jgi:hypothetical protein